MKQLLLFATAILISLNVIAQEPNPPAEKTDSSAQKPDTARCPIKDIGDILHGNKPPKKSHPQKNYFIFLTPVVGSAPATGAVLGVAGQITFKGSDPASKYSLVNANAQFTSKGQTLFQIKNNLLLAHNKLFASGDFRIFIYSQPTYGLGTDALNDTKSGGINIGDQSLEPDSIAQEMKFNYFRYHQLFAYKFRHLFYLGAGVDFDIYTHIQDLDLNLAAGDTTYHYSYCTRHGFDTDHYTILGGSINAIIDTRDNQVNATKGLFLNLSFIGFPSFSEAQKSSTRLLTEFRYFKSFKVFRQKHTAALWLFGTYVISGEAPYLTLPAIGWDQRGRMGRGYAQGTFRGEDILYGEFEYRFPITCNQFLGGVIYVNAVSTTDKDRDVRMFSYIQPAFGLGLRVNMDKASRTNLVLDYAVGKKSSGFYLNAGETY